MSVAEALVVLLVIAGAWFDLRTGKIPNRLTLPLVLAGLLLSAFTGSGSAFLSSLLSVLVTLVIGIPVSRAGLLGGGDVKMIAAIGALLGHRLLLQSLLWTALLGAAASLFMLAARRALLPFLRRLLATGYGRLRWGAEEPLLGAGGHSIALGVVIAAGTVIALLTARMGIGLVW